jgi:hypothetical protein
MTMAVVVACLGADGCGGQQSTSTGSQAQGSAAGSTHVVAARTYLAQVGAVCKHYNTEIKQIDRRAPGSREHEAQLAAATDAATISEARALMQVHRPPGFGRLERLYRAMASAANVANESTRLFSAGQLGEANAASLRADDELRAVNRTFDRVGLPTCAE